MDEAAARARMVERQLAARGIRDPRVLAAFGEVPRHRFVPPALRDQAYDDEPLAIGQEQTISQPYICALMLERLQLQGTERVLEVGTGSGYTTALLARLAREVYAIERLPLLAERAGQLLRELGIGSVTLTVGDGSAGWPAHAPYDAMLVTAAAPAIPEPLAAQLADGGRLVMPVGARPEQTLYVCRREGAELRQQPVARCRFVPLIGRYAWSQAE